MFSVLGFLGTLSPLHWVIIGIVVLLLFGNRLPSVMRSLGQGIVEFKKGLRDAEGEGDEKNAPKQISQNIKK